MRTPLIWCLAVYLSASLVAQDSRRGSGPAAAGREAFENGLKLARETAVRGKPQAARDQLLALFRAHENADYVFARRPEIAELVKNCAFAAQCPDPPLKSLISGELISFDAQSGAVKVRYVPAKMADWEGKDLKVHPVKFRGPYSIELKGARYPSIEGQRMAVGVCAGDVGMILVVFGVAAENFGMDQKWLPARLLASEKDTETVLDKKEHSPCRTGKPYALKVRVTDSEVIVLHGGQVMMSGRRLKDYGNVVLAGEVPDEIILEGRAEPSWLLGLLDEARTKKRMEFERTFVLSRELPDWLLTEPPSVPTERKKVQQRYPDVLTADQAAAAERAQQFIERHESAAGIRHVERLGPEALPAATRAFLLASLYYDADRLGDAESMLERVKSLQPKFWPAEALRARILAETGRHADAAAAYKSLLKAAPDDVDVAVDAAKAALMAGRGMEAKTIVDGALARKHRSAELDTFNSLLVKALNGPPWPTRFEVKSQNFVIASDIDRKTCEEAARILEDGYVAYTSWLDRVPTASTEPFRVYLFSGEAGYAAWTNDLIGVVPQHTAGLYSPVLKVLLIWNVPSREEMLRTVRHEGFHQYLDRLMADPPSWFNEGLAEYFEAARLENGVWRSENKRHLATLAENSLTPLDQFLFGSPREFYRNAELHYAEAWAFVAFLQHSSPENKQLFQKLWAALRENTGADRALAKVLPAAEVARLEREFGAWLKAKH